MSADFAVDQLNDEERKIANAIVEMLGESCSGGGCRAFYGAPEWRTRGEDWGNDAVLVIVHDGGDLAPFCNWYYGQHKCVEELQGLLDKLGYYVEQCTSWYSAVYRFPDPQEEAPSLLDALRFLLADYEAIEGEKLTGSSVPADLARAAIAAALAPDRE